MPPYLYIVGLRRRQDEGSRPWSGSELRANGGAEWGGGSRSLPSTLHPILKSQKESKKQRPQLHLCINVLQVEKQAQTVEVTGTGPLR